MLGSMKGIKMSGLTQKMSELIGNLRVKEVQAAKMFRHLNVYGAILGMHYKFLGRNIVLRLYTPPNFDTDIASFTHYLHSSLFE
jgi:hypothetical protein